MPTAVTKGQCLVCNCASTKSSMSSHLRSCLRKELKAGTGPSSPQAGFHVAVEGAYNCDYWLHLAVREDATFDHLDGFLRAIWLECCGHLSAFKIGETEVTSDAPSLGPARPADDDQDEYEDDETPGSDSIGGRVAGMLDTLRGGNGLSGFDGHMGSFGRFQARSMDTPVGELLRPKLRFKHDYDFGSTTTLALRVVSELEAGFGGDYIRPLARNHAPNIPCHLCGKPATQVSAEYAYSEEGWLCDKCLASEDYDGEMMLPVVNSPRTGVCGYTGDGGRW